VKASQKHHRHYHHSNSPKEGQNGERSAAAMAHHYEHDGPGETIGPEHYTHGEEYDELLFSMQNPREVVENSTQLSTIQTVKRNWMLCSLALRQPSRRTWQQFI
jgi:hypothetical protein